MTPIELPQPYLLFLGDTVDPTYAKTAYGLRDWAPEHCVGELVLPAGKVSTGLPSMTPAEAARAGARSLLIGVVNSGGFIPESWVPTLVEALEAGLDIVSGLHRRLATVPALKEAAERLGRRLIDIRVPPENLGVGTGKRRTGRRLLTVGTDCALGKKYTALALARALSDRGVDADFRATGQTGIMISGRGIPIDAVVVDFVSGAAELLSPDASADHWDVIEGQGSLLHPSFAAVTLGLLHGSQPDILVLCHDPRRTEIRGLTGFIIPPLPQVMELYLSLARLTNPAVRFAGISLNTGGMTDAEADAALAAAEAATGLPAADPLRDGPALARLVDACLN
ncbi:MAG TPA: DUF1611 domain-containing protein [Sphingomonas sp.]|uniref:DUF1611 domain-containing protein n=1 Tax=Sphingomonas sp. TaxID=28214 RepID=UPI002CB67D56|nr:DUF1611 domain-containing protein [Sphingomonas sp.]HMI20019.1 DUF1611 domain-containing protein [Sphingomonas sp.]